MKQHRVWPPLRAYSHIDSARDVPTTYQIVSSRLLYYVARGFEVDGPAAAWYQRHQRGCPLVCRDWESFGDPRETTYTSYVQRAAQSESHLDAVVKAVELSGHDSTLTPEWLALSAGVMAPMRYVWHAFQMVAAYIGQMAPSGRITLVALFQAGDEMRRVHRIAQRMGQLREAGRAYGADAREAWQDHPAWQPLRRVIEECLVTYDWGESFAALCLGIKPVMDDLILGEMAHLARRRGDLSLGQTLDALALDGLWHRQWASALVALAHREDAGNAATLKRWLTRWRPAAAAAGASVATLLGQDAVDGADGAVARIQRSSQRTDAWLRDLGLQP